MRLNGLSISEYGICRNLRIDNLHQGFNLIHGRNGSGKSTLSKFIKNVLNGFQLNESHNGYLEVSETGLRARLSREIHQSSRLVIDNPSFVSKSLESNIPSEVYFVDGRNLANASNQMATLLSTRFHVPVGDDALGNNTMFQKASHSTAVLQTKLEGISAQIAGLESERNQLVSQIDHEENTYQSRRKDLENRAHHLTMRIDSMNVDDLQGQIETIDREIADLRIKMETANSKIQYVSKPYKTSDGLAILYRRLDELDNQIRRWRAVHTDIQEQRVRLKDEMVVWNELTMESNDHPYHRSRQLLNAIESSLLKAEGSIHDFQNQRSMDNQSAAAMASELSSHCSRIRDDLYVLCEELGSQYKTVRHRSAAAEFKRLRRCYHEIGDNIEALIGHRRRILEEIRQLDPAGASAIVRADNDFCSCAQHEGYLQARRKFIGEFEQRQQRIEVIKPDESIDNVRLVQLQQQRADRVRELVQMENELSTLKAQRKAMVAELDQFGTLVDLSSIRAALEKIQFELEAKLAERKNILEELDWNKSIRPQPINPLLESASHWIQRLTDGEIRVVWISQVNFDLMIENRNADKFQFQQLGSGLQQQVVLGICLAIANYQRELGVEHPVVLDDVFVNLDPQMIQCTFNALLHFCEHGNQVIALTSDQTVIELAGSRNMVSYSIPSFDLPETSVSPVVPIWSPDRSPSYPTRHDEFLQSQRTSLTNEYTPQLSRFTGNRETEYHRFQTPSTNAVAEAPHVLVNRVNENSDLSVLLLGDAELENMNRIGIFSIGQLLETDPSFVDSESDGASSEQIDFWQSLAWMLICVPALDIEDAELLIAVDINEPEQLESTHAQQLLDRISRFLGSNGGRRPRRDRNYNRDLINSWYDSLDQTRSKWRLPSGYSRRNRWRNSNNRRSNNRNSVERSSWRERSVLGLNRDSSRRERRSRSRFEQPGSNGNSGVESQVNESPQSVEPQSSVATKLSAANLKFYLNQSDELEAAPSIGPKTAERFTKIGVVTVGEFLAQTAESMSSKINYKRITAEVIRQWQHQARLVCRVPNLRGHDAQLLVACGITEPEDLAAKNADSLFGVIQPFAESKDGLKIIRGGKQPDLEEITEWISWAKQTRSLQAA